MNGVEEYSRKETEDRNKQNTWGHVPVLRACISISFSFLEGLGVLGVRGLRVGVWHMYI
jgi:hypothetical protein